MGAEIKIDGREVLNVVRFCIGIDIERIVRYFIGVGGVFTAEKLAIDRVAWRHGARAVAEVDGVARHFARASRIAAVDCLYNTARNRDGVTLHGTITFRIAAVNCSCWASDGTAFDSYLVFNHIAVGAISSYAAVDVLVCIAALERRRIALDDPRAAIFCHAAD